MKFGTRLLHYDQAPQDPFRPMATPIYQTATFEQEAADSFGEFDYTRSGNPTRRVFEDQMARLEGGARGFAFASGMAAIAAVTRLLKPGDEILADVDLYGGTSRLFGKLPQSSGVMVRFADATRPEEFAAAITPATRLVYAESPSNPLLRILDLRALAEIAHSHQARFCVDSSAMSPYLQNPLALGADIVLHSATKFLCGHSDVTGGVVIVKDEALAKGIYFVQNAEGTGLAPFDCFLLLRGLKTLKLRLDAQQRSAAALVRHLKQHPRVVSVTYPGDHDHAGYALHMSQASGGGSLFTFQAGSAARAKDIAEKVGLFKIAVSFGSVISTLSLPAAMSHASVPAEQKSGRFLPEDLVRVSVGIEDVDDLIAAFDEVL